MLGRVAWVAHQAFWVPLRLITCSLNYLTGGEFHETFCSRVWRQHHLVRERRAFWRVVNTFLDVALFFDKEHCWNQFLKTAHREPPRRWSIAWLWQTF